MAELDQAPFRGELRKQSPHLGVFRRRNVVLTASGLQIYRLGEEEKALSVLPIAASTTVSEIKLQSVRGSHGAAHPDQAVFQVLIDQDDQATSNYRLRIFGSSQEQHWFSAKTMQEAEAWKAAIEARAKALAGAARDSKSGVSAVSERPLTSETVETVSVAPSVTSRDASNVTQRMPKDKRMQRSKSQFIRELPNELRESINLIQRAQWREVLTTNGFRILAETAHGAENPVLLINCVLPASPDRARRMIFNFGRRTEWDSLTESVQRLDTGEEDDSDNSITLHYKLKGQRVGGFWVAPRDCVVESTWRTEEDGSVVILEASKHGFPECPGYVRAQIYSLGITLCPRRRVPKGEEADDLFDGSSDASSTVQSEECLLQMAVHANVGGWLAKMPVSWSQQWLYTYMLRVIGLREILQADNFAAVDFFNMTKKVSSPPINAPPSLLDMKRVATSSGGTLLPAEAQQPLLPQLEGSLPRSQCYNCDDPFNVRSKTYLQNKKKVTSGATMFELIAADLFEVDSTIEHVAVNMKGGFADRYLHSPGPKPFLFILHFQIPGPPFLSFIAYFAARPGSIENISPFSKLFADFIEGTDSFRNSRFKFIPRVVKGSYMVRSAVGSTPCLLGNKLACSYFAGNGYFEVDVDVGSSKVAGGVLGVVKGYVTSLTIDLCVLLEAQDDEELPEEILGALRFEKLSLDMAKKWVPSSN